jgi:hypothetical protein
MSSERESIDSKPENKSREPVDKVESEALKDEQLDEVTGAGGGLVPRVPGPSPQTP